MLKILSIFFLLKNWPLACFQFLAVINEFALKNLAQVYL